MTMERLLQGFLMYVVVSTWLLAGLGDWFCHRRTRIELTSGVRESLLHVLQFGLVGLPMLAVLFLEVNAAVLLSMLVGLVLHQATAVWDVRFASRTRGIAPAEQHIHGMLEMIPAVATAMVVILNWPAFLSLLGVGQASFAVEPKKIPLPAWCLSTVLIAVVAFGALPYGEELFRAWRAYSKDASKMRTPAGRHNACASRS